MSLLFPRFAYAPARTSPISHDIGPLFNLFDETFNELSRASRQNKTWNPRFDLRESKEAYALEGELPGIDQKDLSIEFTDEHTLIIKGRTERHSESGRRPGAIAAGEEKAAIEDVHSDAASDKSHHATVEDDEPANGSAVAAAEAPSAEVAKTNKPATPAAPEHQYWISERHVGEFSRSFNFPTRVNQDAVKASLKNGILSIVVPKAPAPESRRIRVE
ncbi:hypothetical protein B0A52_02878 [Exophiala mesophila]|uniref:SHSP domain-containing protein n=1 Tax=Exophiala mesophila TaxID=212818 RepID=A0A438NE48_EXOME|nr:hypothetical protein B0A52_02878 [Exophiala mesophila]